MVIALGDSVYFAVVPYSRDFASNEEHLSMAMWAVDDDAAICSLTDQRLKANMRVVPPGWAIHEGKYRYGDVCTLSQRIEHASYSGVTGAFKWKGVDVHNHSYLFADETIDQYQLPSVIHISSDYEDA
jgi:hypothetical protein